MIAPESWHLPADLLARVARYKARKPRPVQRAAYRARMLERAEANYRRTVPVRGVDAPAAHDGRGNDANNASNNANADPGPDGAPPNLPEGVL